MEDVSWACGFYQAFYQKALNSLIQFYRGDTDYLIATGNSSNFQKVTETFFLDKQKTQLVKQTLAFADQKKSMSSTTN